MQCVHEEVYPNQAIAFEVINFDVAAEEVARWEISWTFTALRRVKKRTKIHYSINIQQYTTEILPPQEFVNNISIGAEVITFNTYSEIPMGGNLRKISQK